MAQKLSFWISPFFINKYHLLTDITSLIEKYHFKGNVLDFGCGGGYIISSLTCKRRIGIEINEIARQEAAEKGIEVYKYSNEVPDDSCDLIISNHALEHVSAPYEEIKIQRQDKSTPILISLAKWMKDPQGEAHH